VEYRDGEIGMRPAAPMCDTAVTRAAAPAARVSDDAEPAGVGVRLPVVREVVERHGGCVPVRSEPGRGRRFRVTLPILRPAS
jgi:signal transduction histidine kinase